MEQTTTLSEDQIENLAQALEVLDAYIQAVEVGTLENLDDLNQYLSKLSHSLEKIPVDENLPPELKTIRLQLEKLVQSLTGYREALLKENEAQTQQASGALAYQKGCVRSKRMLEELSQDPLLQKLVWGGVLILAVFIVLRIFLYVMGRGSLHQPVRSGVVRVSKPQMLSPTHRCVEMIWDGVRYLVVLHPQGATVVGQKPVRSLSVAASQEKVA